MLVEGLNPDNIQGYQFQPRRDSYTDESSESDHGGSSGSDNDGLNSVTRLGNLDW